MDQLVWTQMLGYSSQRARGGSQDRQGEERRGEGEDGRNLEAENEHVAWAERCMYRAQHVYIHSLYTL